MFVKQKTFATAPSLLLHDEVEDGKVVKPAFESFPAFYFTET